MFNSLLKTEHDGQKQVLYHGRNVKPSHHPRVIRCPQDAKQKEMQKAALMSLDCRSAENGTCESVSRREACLTT